MLVKQFIGTRALSIGLFGLFLSTQYALLLGNKNIFTLEELDQKTLLIEYDIDQLELSNQTLIAEVIDLKEKGESIEAIARSRLGYIKKGETFFQIID